MKETKMKADKAEKAVKNAAGGIFRTDTAGKSVDGRRYLSTMGVRGSSPVAEDPKVRGFLDTIVSRKKQ